MNKPLQIFASGLIALLAVLALVTAPSAAQAQPASAYSQQELEQMLAPVALYPDALLSQILMASTYPLEVIEAARWSAARPGLAGDDAVRAAAGEDNDWDPSVMSLVAFPQVLARMRENLQWTQSLGDAFLGQQAQVMDTVQALRRRAQAAGNLFSDDRVRVLDNGQELTLAAPDSGFIYIPWYDPQLVYGTWWWPAYPPVHWRPWPGYYARRGHASAVYWGAPVGIAAGFFSGAFDWPRRNVRVVRIGNYHDGNGVAANRWPGAMRAPGAWRREPEHRGGIAPRQAETQARHAAAPASQGRGGRIRPAGLQHAVAHSGALPAAAPAIPPVAPANGRRPDTRPAMETRARARATPAAHPAAAMQIAPAGRRFGHRRDTRTIVQSAPAAALVRPAPGAHPAPGVQHAPVLGTARAIAPWARR